jgi:hypothetical protein
MKLGDVLGEFDPLKITTPDSPAPLIGALSPETADAKATEHHMFHTSQLDECLSLAESLRDMLQSDEMALKVVGLLSYGLRKSGELSAEALYRFKMAKSERKRCEAIAALENFSHYMAEKRQTGTDLRATDQVRGHYVAIDPDVLRANEREAYYEALLSQLESYKMEFTMSLSAVKAMISKQRADQLISDTPTPTANT